MYRLKENVASKNDGVIRMVLVHNTEFDMNMADQWHERFLWKLHKRTMFNYNRWPRDIGRWHGDAFRNWCVDEGTWSHDNYTDINSHMAAYSVVVYQRSVESPFLGELGRLQTECEDVIEEIHENELRIENAESEMKKIWARLFGTERERLQSIIQEAKQRINELYPSVERLLKEADNIRSVILQQR